MEQNKQDRHVAYAEKTTGGIGMKKRMSAKAGWLFVAVFVGLHLLYCVLDLQRCLLISTSRYDAEPMLYKLVEQASAVLRFFLAGSSFIVRTGRWIWPQDIAGACLIGSFVVAVTVWMLAHYGWKKTYLFWGVALALSILLCSAIGAAAGRLVTQRAIESRNFAEVPIRCAVYVCIYQIPTWLLYRGSRQLARDIVKDREA